VGGKSFHTYTRGCERPYDLGLMADMDATALAFCENVEGAQLAFVQSDEISVLLTDLATMQTEAWFDGSVQKLASLSASLVTTHFNLALMRRLAGNGWSRRLGRPDNLTFWKRLIIETHADAPRKHFLERPVQYPQREGRSAAKMFHLQVTGFECSS